MGTTTTSDGRDHGEVRRRVAPPSPRQAAWLLRRVDDAPASLAPDEHAYVVRRCASVPRSTRRACSRHSSRPCVGRATRTASEPWLDAARGTELQAFVTGIERDRDAVLAALCSRWSTGQVEGQVQRLKVVKRGMHGRAKFDLLRKRVLHAA